MKGEVVGMSPEAKARCKAAYERKRKERLKEQLERQAARGSADNFRRRRLARYTQHVLRLHGAERLRFFEANPIGNIFK